MGIISFYSGETPDNNGRYIKDILAFSDEELENDHNYIQWLFPNREPSIFNPEAPLITNEVIEEFKLRHDLLDMVIVASNRMNDFYYSANWITKNNHNFLRCTRILNFLKALEMEKELSYFYFTIKLLSGNKKDIVGERTFSFWKNAFEGKLNGY